MKFYGQRLLEGHAGKTLKNVDRKGLKPNNEWCLSEWKERESERECPWASRKCTRDTLKVCEGAFNGSDLSTMTEWHSLERTSLTAALRLRTRCWFLTPYSTTATKEQGPAGFTKNRQGAKIKTAANSWSVERHVKKNKQIHSYCLVRAAAVILKEHNEFSVYYFPQRYWRAEEWTAGGFTFTSL